MHGRRVSAGAEETGAAERKDEQRSEKVPKAVDSENFN